MVEPTTSLDARYSGEGATATRWSDAVAALTRAELFWLSTVRPDGRPHVTPLLAVWLGDTLYFCTGGDERKAVNLAANPECVLTTGANALREGLDIVVEGTATVASDHDLLQRVADTYEAKYGSEWHFEVEDGRFRGDAPTPALVFEVRPKVAFGFGKGEYSQTRWRF
ncbi:pyridoxamine 5'-phosphate oxidase family protein [Fodinicola acaciae]|uniref:pyridoxamine 5'-phosphate oxidase family protein n=1 Tax=Fodinicola acaciae TaxID=2681555 RepID=UPI0013D4109C|nr:pyridoxamine 5'-phosphate oxidase family protein [Fodinicola acaciae]